jgi:mannosyltransferase OCH1-like enzyme
MWPNQFSQLFNVHGDSDLRQTEIHTAEPLVPQPSAFEVEMGIEKLKRPKSLAIDQIPAEFIIAGSQKIGSVIHRLYIWNDEELPEEWNEMFVVCTYICGWTYDWVSSKYKLIVLIFCDIHCVDVLLAIKKTSFAVVSVIDHYYGLVMLFCICQYP